MRGVDQAVFSAPLVVASPPDGVRHAEPDLVDTDSAVKRDLNGHSRKWPYQANAMETNLVGSFTEGATYSPEQYVAPTVQARMSTGSEADDNQNNGEGDSSKCDLKQVTQEIFLPANNHSD